MGICYGLQLIAKFWGKNKKNLRKKRVWRSEFNEKSKSILFKNFFKNKKTCVWMSHQDAVFKIPKGFKHTASTDSSKYTAIEHKKKNLWFQFHPEVTHTYQGVKVIKNFIFNICKIKKNWLIGTEKKK